MLCMVGFAGQHVWNNPVNVPWSNVWVMTDKVRAPAVSIPFLLAVMTRRASPVWGVQYHSKAPYSDNVPSTSVVVVVTECPVILLVLPWFAGPGRVRPAVEVGRGAEPAGLDALRGHHRRVNE